MRANILGLLAVALMCVCGIARPTPIVYNVYISDGTETVSGTITTDGSIGALVAGDITAWDLKATGSVFVHILSSDFLAFNPFCEVVLGITVPCGLTATPTALVYAFGTPGIALDFLEGDVSVLAAIAFSGGGVGVSVESFAYIIPGRHPTIIATTSNSAPEPATGALLGVALAGLGFARKRSRGRQSTAV